MNDERSDGGSMALVGADMCEECEAFLGHPHKEGCSKHGRIVEQADATWKMTTVEGHMEAEGTWAIGRHRDGQQLSLLPGIGYWGVLAVTRLLTGKESNEIAQELLDSDNHLEFEIGDSTFVVERENDIPQEDPDA